MKGLPPQMLLWFQYFYSYFPLPLNPFYNLLSLYCIQLAAPQFISSAGLGPPSPEGGQSQASWSPCRWRWLTISSSCYFLSSNIETTGYPSNSELEFLKNFQATLTELPSWTHEGTGATWLVTARTRQSNSGTSGPYCASMMWLSLLSLLCTIYE